MKNQTRKRVKDGDIKKMGKSKRKEGHERKREKKREGQRQRQKKNYRYI